MNRVIARGLAAILSLACVACTARDTVHEPAHLQDHDPVILDEEPQEDWVLDVWAEGAHDYDPEDPIWDHVLE